MVSNEKNLRKQGLVALFILVIPIVVIVTFNLSATYYEQRDFKLLNLSAVNKDPSFCFEMKSVGLKNQCFLEIAKQNKDIALCDSLVDIKTNYDHITRIFEETFGGGRRVTHNNRDNCINEVRTLLIEDAVRLSNYSYCKNDGECVYLLATRLNDSEHCYDLTGGRIDSCFLEISKNTKEIGLCGNINGTASKESCYYFFTSFIHNDEKLCELIPKDKTEECYYALALNTSSIKYCSRTENNEGLCFFNIAKNVNKPGYCIKAKSYESECWNFFALNNSEEEFCKVSGDSEACYYNLALQIKNPELCKNAGNTAANCFYMLAILNYKPEICLNAEPSNVSCNSDFFTHEQKATCRYIGDPVSTCIYFASKSTSAYCNYIINEYSKDRCYRNIAVNNSDTTLCELSDDFKENCYFEIAMKENRLDLCSKAGPWKSECIEELKAISG